MKRVGNTDLRSHHDCRFTYKIDMQYHSHHPFRRGPRSNKPNKWFWIVSLMVTAFAILYLTVSVTISNAQEHQIAAETSNVYFVTLDGDDTNPGTESSPWRTIQHAADHAEAGDVIYVKEGLYDERVITKHSGLPENRITFKALPRQSVTMRGFEIVYTDYIRIEGFRIENEDSCALGTDDFQSKSGIYIRSDYIDIVDNAFYHLKSVAIMSFDWVEEKDYPRFLYIADNYIYGCSMGIWLSGVNSLVENNEIERLVHNCGGDSDYMRLMGGEKIIIRNNHFHGTRRDEAPYDMAHVDGWQTNDGYASDDTKLVIIDNNRISDFDQGLMSSNYGDDSILTFRNNIFHINDWGGSWGLCVGAFDNVRAVNNTFVNLRYHGIGFTNEALGGYVLNNIFYLRDGATSYWSDPPESIGDYNLTFQVQDPELPGPHDLLGVDPLFVDDANDDFHLQSDSPCIDQGGFLTHTTESGSGIEIPVAYAGFFHDGFEITQGDLIKVGTNPLARITKIDYATNRITVDTALSWNNGDPVSLPYAGSAPDIGAFEFDQIYENEDINRDGLVDQKDTILCVNVVLGSEVNPDLVIRSDINGDGIINVLDVQSILNVILSD